MALGSTQIDKRFTDPRYAHAAGSDDPWKDGSKARTDYFTKLGQDKGGFDADGKFTSRMTMDDGSVMEEKWKAADPFYTGSDGKTYFNEWTASDNRTFDPQAARRFPNFAQKLSGIAFDKNQEAIYKAQSHGQQMINDMLSKSQEFGDQLGKKYKFDDDNYRRRAAQIAMI